MDDKAKGTATWTVEKFANKQAYLENKPYDIITKNGNVWLNSGIEDVLGLTMGSAGVTKFDNSNAHIGVGTGTDAAAAAQTGLVGNVVQYIGMDASYPAVSATAIQFKSTFGSGDANFPWNEWGVASGSGTGEAHLNRKTESLGTKSGGNIWTMLAELSIS